MDDNDTPRLLIRCRATESEEEDALPAEAVLAIGDEAIRLKLEGSYQYCLDLGEVWLEHTGLPFVFAVCAVREDFCKQYEQQTRQIHRTLVDCRDKGVADLARICSLAAPRIPMEVSSCHSYLKGIEYDLDEHKRKALTVFFLCGGQSNFFGERSHVGLEHVADRE